MKRAKLLSLFLAGCLLFQSAGIDAMATAPSDPAPISETVKDTDNDSEQSSEKEKGSDESTEEERNPELSSEGETEKDPDGGDGTPELPSEDEDKKDPDGEDGTPELPSEDENEKDPDGEEETPELPSEDEDEKDPDGEEETPELPSESEKENGESVSENTVSENTISENTLAEEDSLFSIFPGLGDSYQFSSQELADKRVLSAHVGDVVKISSLENAALADFKDASDSYVPGEVIYMAESLEEAEQVAAAFGGTLDSYAYEVACISLPEKATVALAITAAAQPEIKLPAVWPNYYQYLYEDTYSTVTPPTYSDPGFSQQWQHDYIGTRYAWAAGYKGQDIRVAVIDTGLQMNHEDLKANALQGKNFVGMGGKSEDVVAPNHSVDNQTHGTHVAGIIAADDNGKGGIGIAPDAKVAGFCVFPTGENSSADTKDTIRAINAAVEDGYDIINMSLGGPSYNQAYEKAVQAARNKGVAIFAASGNEDISAKAYPAAYAGTISVGAIDQNGSRASFSNYGGTVNLAFPGVSIYSTIPTGYAKMDGTSMACPAAAGTAAVILSARADIRNKAPKDRVNALLSAMKSSTTKCVDSGMGAGTTYLPGVLKIATDMTAPETPVITVAGTPVDKAGKTYIAEKVTVTLSSKTAVGVDIYYSTTGKTPAYKSGAITNADSTTPYKIGDSITLTGAKSKTIKAIAVNPLSGKVSKVASKTVTLTPIPTGVTVAPVGGVTKIAAGKSLKFTATVAPDYAISKNVKWEVAPSDANITETDITKLGINISNGTVTTTGKGAKKTPAGTYQVTAMAVGSSDVKKFDGKQGVYKFTVIESSTIKKVAFVDAANKNKAPAAKSIKTTDSKTTDTNVALNLAPYLTVTKPGATSKEPDVTLTGADALAEVVWSSSNTKVATVTDGVITAKAPGKATIKATSNDGLNKSASYNVTVVQPVTGITISGPTKVAVGKSIALAATVTPANATNKKLEWSIKDSTGAVSDKVSINKANGKVSTKKGAEGTFTVTAKAADKLGAADATYTITIENQEITKIEFPKNSRSLTMFPPNTSAKNNTTATLVPTIEGKAAGSKDKPTVITTSLITWSSSAPSIASVNQNGKITAVAPGKATITCAATDGSNRKATCKVTVTVPMSKLVIGPKDGNLDARIVNKAIANEGCVAVGKKIKMAAKYYGNYGTPTSNKIVWNITDYGDSTLDGKVKIDANGQVSVDKSLKDNLPDTSKAYVYVQATAKDGSGVTSNKYRVNIKKNYLAARIVWANGGFMMLASTSKNGSSGWEFVPDYCTASLSGSKNCGLAKNSGTTSDDPTTVLAVYNPVPNKNCTTKPTRYDCKKTCEKMTLTLKLKDGSNLSAKLNLYAGNYGDSTYYFY